MIQFASLSHQLWNVIICLNLIEENALMVDWGFATQIAGIGFLTVFVVLGILSLVLWLVNLLLNKVIGKPGKSKQEGS